MKKSIQNLFLAVLAMFSAFQVQAIQFEQQASWADILKRAGEANKMIFVDAYATWCGPCKMMDRDVFPDESVSAYFDQEFICVKIDMESERGEEFGKSFEVGAYPTLLFISPSGELVKENVGAIDAEKLLSLGKYVKNPSSSPIGALRKQYEAGERSTAFLEEYIAEMDKVGETHPEAAQTLLLALDPEKVATSENYFVILYQMEFAIDSEMGRYFSKHFGLYLKEYEQYAYQKLVGMLNEYLGEGVEKSDRSYFERAIAYTEGTVKDSKVKKELVQSISKAMKEKF